ncbi:MAG: alpha/beta fold hydrolase, partial [Planctomycetes bacterium]|nr:alpha/beta fold hydrolase [Planctomycetota bacterium]
MKSSFLLSGLAVNVLFPASFAAGQDDWPQFRGPNSLGVSENKELPERWTDKKNVLWRRDMPGRGWSSPVVWGDRVFITTVINHGESEEPKKGLYFGGNRRTPSATEHEWKVYCLDLKTGDVAWDRVVNKRVPRTSLHIKNSYASETPVTDGEHLFVYFGNVGVFCFTLDGKEVWSKKFDARKTRYAWGTAASPVLHKDRLYIVNDNDEESYLLALEKETGKQVWQTKRDEKSNWATPYVWENKLRTEIIVPGTGKFRSYDLDGKLLYEFGGGSSITIATPYSKSGLLYVSSGYIGDRKKPLFAIRPGAAGDISLADDETSNDHIAWCQKRAAPYNPTTLVYRDLLYVLLDRGILACYDAKTGKTVYGRQRLPNGRAFTSSPWAFDGKIFCLNEYGETFVVKAGSEFELLHTNSLADDEMCMATPAIAGDKLIIRSEDHIYCLQEGAELKEKESAVEETAKSDKPATGIQKRTYDFKEADKEMEYALFVPTSYDKEKSSPLMVALHGLGSSSQGIIRYRGLTRLAEEHGYIVVAPMGYNSRGWYGSRGKNTGRGRDPRNLGELSEKDVMNVLEITRKELNIDENRIYLMGHSMGGRIGLSMALNFPSRVKSLVLASSGSGPAARSGSDCVPGLPFRLVVELIAMGFEEFVRHEICESDTYFTREFRERYPERVKAFYNVAWSTHAKLPEYVQLCIARSTWEATHRLGDVGVPTLVVVGDQDVLGSNHVAQAEVLAKRIPGSEHKILKGQSHGFFWQVP